MARGAGKGVGRAGLYTAVIMESNATRLIVVRHAQSESNKAKFYAAATNVNLTELGREQAEKTAEFLRDYHIDRAYSSPMVRVIQTAKPIVRDRGLTLEIEPDLREIDGGIWEGLSYEEIETCYHHERNLWYNDFINCVCPGGDSVYELYHRVRLAFKKIITENRGKTVLVASHATPIRLMLTRFLEKPITEANNTPWPGNASVTIVDCFEDDTYHIELFAYNEHLK